MAARDGDQTAFRQLYDASSGRLFSVAFAILSNAADAEEAVSEVYAQAWRTSDRYDTSRGAVMTWLSMMCRSRSLDMLRRQRMVTEEIDEHNLPAFVDDQSSDDTARALSNAMSGLNEIQRQMLALAFFRGLTHQEISEHTGQPLGTVKSHIRRALLNLREQLGPSELA